MTGPIDSSVSQGAARPGRVGCVVLNWRDTARTAACVGSLIDDPSIGKVIVVDNESDGKVRADLDRKPFTTPVRVIEHEQNRGFAAGINVGLDILVRDGFEFILCINNDAQAREGSIARMVDRLDQSHTLGLVAPTIWSSDGQLIGAGGRFNRLLFKTHPLHPDGVTYLTWACVLIRREVFQEIGFLNERYFMYWEDVEFSLRALSAGYALALVEGATVVHHISSSHAAAGVRISAYSAMGIVVLARELGYISWPGAFIRISGRILRAATRRPQLLPSIVQGVRSGLHVSEGEPAYRLLYESGFLE